jgi:hypothetical protein
MLFPEEIPGFSSPHRFKCDCPEIMVEPMEILSTCGSFSHCLSGSVSVLAEKSNIVRLVVLSSLNFPSAIDYDRGASPDVMQPFVR